MLAVEAFTAEGLDIYRHAVARFHALHIGSRFFHHAHHLVAHGYSGHGSWHAAVLDVEVARADASERDAHNGVGRFLKLWLRFVDKGEIAFLNICVCFHKFRF